MAGPEDTSGAGDPLDVLRRLEERLDAASEAAERLLADATRQASRAVPPRGWQAPREDSAGAAPGDAELVLAVLGALRDRIPPELQQRLTEALREVLLAVRALIDWYLARSERPRRDGGDIEDIPIL